MYLSGDSLLEHLDKMPMVDRKLNGPVMIPISEKYKDMGTIVVGKIESGVLHKGDTLLLMPNKVEVEVAAIHDEMEEEVDQALCGDNIRIRLRGIEDEDITPGFVLTSPNKPVHAVRQFEAQLAILEHKNIICAGYSAVMHCHTLAEEVTLSVRPFCASATKSLLTYRLNVGFAALLRQGNRSQVPEASSICQERYGHSCPFYEHCSLSTYYRPENRRSHRNHTAGLRGAVR